MRYLRSILFLAALLIALSACGDTGTTTTGGSPTQGATSAPVATPTPTHALTWKTIQTFSGSGSKKTAIFTVPGDWKILWSCKGGDFGVDGALSVTIYGTQNSYIDGLIETCKAGTATTTKGESEEHQGGSVYLDIGGSTPWQIQVQAML